MVVDQTVSLLARAVSNKARTLVGYEKLLSRLPDEKLKAALTGIIENEQRHLEVLSSILTALSDEKGKPGQSAKPGPKQTSPKVKPPTGNDLELVQKLLQAAMKGVQGRPAGVVKAAVEPAVPGDKWTLKPTPPGRTPETEPKTGAKAEPASEAEPEPESNVTLTEDIIRDEFPPKAEDAVTAIEPVPDEEPVSADAPSGTHETDAGSSVPETPQVSDQETEKPDEESAPRAEEPAPKKFKPLVWKFF